VRNVYRVLDQHPCPSLTSYVRRGGGEALARARALQATEIIDLLGESGLRGRGGAGFPTATKWKSVFEYASPTIPTPVIVNAAEGEPSTFKDRTILRNNPYRVIEGALIGCVVMKSEELIFAMKESFSPEWVRVETAMNEMKQDGWFENLRVRLVAGPGSYLFGEETALLEVVNNRQPFPRVTPPWRRGLGDQETTQLLSATAEMATPNHDGGAPALINNVETFANVALIVRHGAPWFREVGTEGSPGTVVCTIVGDVQRSGVGEYPMGTSLDVVIHEIGGGSLPGRRIIGVLPGASSALLSDAHLATPLSHEDFQGVGSGLGAAGFHCVDDAADPFLLAHSASRFLSVESCGQCLPCKEDGLAITGLLGQLIDGTAPADVEARLAKKLGTVVNEARCYLATQQQVVIGSLNKLCNTTTLQPPNFGETRPIDLNVILPLLDIVDGKAIYDQSHGDKQPDWSFEPTDSGIYPAQRLQAVSLETEPPLTL
jgi:NADH-quinone oxidoreductase subunit F